jgi:hypothetical protein
LKLKFKIPNTASPQKIHRIGAFCKGPHPSLLGLVVAEVQVVVVATVAA